MEPLVERAPRWVGILTDLGVPFARRANGELALRAGLGASRRRVVTAGLDTGRLVRDVLDDEVRRLETATARTEHGVSIPGESWIHRIEPAELAELVVDEGGVAVGVVVRHTRSGELLPLPADGVCLTRGSALELRDARFEASAALGVAFARGALVAGLEWRDWAPLGVTTDRGYRPLGEGLLALGARLFTPKDPADPREPTQIPEREREPFEVGYTASGTQRLVDGSTLARRVRAVTEQGAPVFLDVSALHEAERELGLPHAALGAGRRRELAGAWRVGARVLGSLGGLWTAVSPSVAEGAYGTSVPGLYACGSAAMAARGAGELGGHALLAELATAEAAAEGLAAHRAALARSALDVKISVFEKTAKREQVALNELAGRSAETGSLRPIQVAEALRESLQTALERLEPHAAAAELHPIADRLADELPRLHVADAHLLQSEDWLLARRLTRTAPLLRALAAACSARANEGDVGGPRRHIVLGAVNSAATDSAATDSAATDGASEAPGVERRTSGSAVVAGVSHVWRDAVEESA
jgi:succinate dehydrogenase/fumarate reductase flavoprotein subunit